MLVGSKNLIRYEPPYHNSAEIVGFESLKQEVEILPKYFVHTLTDEECQVDAAA